MRAVERTIAGLLCAIALGSLAPVVACGGDDSSMLPGLTSRGGGGQRLPDGGFGSNGFGSDTCVQGQAMCGTTCVDTNTDLNNCGSCGTVCGSTCALGRCVVTLAPGKSTEVGNENAAIALGSSSAYFFGSGGLMSVPLMGGTPTLVGPGGTAAIAVGKASVFYFGPAGLMSVPLAGGAPDVLALGSGSSITVNSAGVCWTAPNGTVESVPLSSAIPLPPDAGSDDGGADAGAGADAGVLVVPTTLASGQEYCDGIVASETAVYWTTNGTLSSAGGFAPQTGTVKGASLLAPVDAGVPDASASDAGTDAGGPLVIAAAQNYATGIAIDTTSVYWVASGTSANGFADGVVMKAPLEGGAPVTLASAQSFPYGIAVDGANVYWTDNDNGGKSGTVMSVPVTGGTPVTLAAGQKSPWSIAVDATSVYWTIGDGSVMKLSPK